MWRSAIWITTGLLTIWAAEALAQTPSGAAADMSFAASAPPATPAPAVPAFSSAAPGELLTGWRAVGLPRGKAPMTRIDLAAEPLTGSAGGSAGGPAGGASRSVLRLQTDRSYGNWVFDHAPWAPSRQATLQWRWRLEQPLVSADLRHKASDDAALKVCVMFDHPIERVPFWERSLLRLARTVTGEALPAATVCYVWDTLLARDTALPNAHSPRVRYLVLRGYETAPGAWQVEQRSIWADFLRLFGDESHRVPAIIGLAVGADSDNASGRSLAFVGDIRWAP